MTVVDIVQNLMGVNKTLARTLYIKCRQLLKTRHAKGITQYYVKEMGKLKIK